MLAKSEYTSCALFSALPRQIIEFCSLSAVIYGFLIFTLEFVLLFQ